MRENCLQMQQGFTWEIIVNKFTQNSCGKTVDKFSKELCLILTSFKIQQNSVRIYAGELFTNSVRIYVGNYRQIQYRIVSNVDYFWMPTN